jgi:hypothetical protein
VSVSNGAQAIGPAIVCVLIVIAGEGGCFLLNSASFIGIVVALRRMDTAQLEPSQRVEQTPGQIAERLRSVRRLLIPLVMMALICAPLL